MLTAVMTVYRIVLELGVAVYPWQYRHVHQHRNGADFVGELDYGKVGSPRWAQNYMMIGSFGCFFEFEITDKQF